MPDFKQRGVAGLPSDLTSLVQVLNRKFAELAGVQEYIKRGKGSPEGVVLGRIGTIYQRTDGGVSTSLYVKENELGDGRTGWVAK